MKRAILILLLLTGLSSHAQKQEQRRAQQQFENDLSVNNLRIYILGGIAARPKKGDTDFQKKYGVHFYDFGCLAPVNISFHNEYNLLVFKYLTEKHETEWENAIRTDVMAWNQWKREK
ncbi:FEKKY domain-containing protein [Flavobacterium sp.]|uniref:FEKKY domain-containing protein n=1 Tax=Flavobacterium sp. TaxID=239 RepID=UPI0040333E75